MSACSGMASDRLRSAFRLLERSRDQPSLPASTASDASIPVTILRRSCIAFVSYAQGSWRFGTGWAGHPLAGHRFSFGQETKSRPDEKCHRLRAIGDEVDRPSAWYESPQSEGFSGIQTPDPAATARCTVTLGNRFMRRQGPTEAGRECDARSAPPLRRHAVAGEAG